MPDAYSEWLDIPANLRPPTYYQLLGIAPSELDPKVIAAAAGERLERLRGHADGPRADEARRLAREVVQARDTLLDPVARLRYDTLTPDAADPWWKPETEPPSATTAPVQGWWQGDVPDEPPPAAPTPPPRTSAAEPAPAPSAPSPTKDWWKAEPGGLPADPVPARQAPPPVPVPPPLPPVAPAKAAAPVIREQSLAYKAPESRGSPALWVLAGVLVVGLGGGAVLYLTKPWATAGPAPDNPPVVEPRANGGPAVAVVASTTVRPAVRTTPATTVSNPVATRTTAPGKVTEAVPPPKNPVPPGSDDPVPAMTFRGHSGGVFGVAVSRSGKTILSISDDRAVLQYSPQERGKHGVVNKLGSPGLAVALCDNDRVAVFCDGGETVVYDLAGRKVRATFENPRGGIRSLAAAPDGSFVLTGTTDGVVRWWGTKSKEIEHMLDLDAKATATALAIAADGRTLAVGLSDGRVAVWDLKGRRETRRWPAHKGTVTAVAWSPDGNRIASAGEDGIANVWQPGGGLVKKLAGHDGPVTGVAWCPDGRRVLTTGIDQTVRLWAEDKGWKADRLGHTPDKAFCLAVDGRGRFVVVGLADGAVQLVPVPAAAAGSNN